MSKSVTEVCRAKLNLFLDVRAKRRDGYHELATVFHEIDLADDLVATTRDEPGASLQVVGRGAVDVPTDGSNLVLRAARALIAESGVKSGVHFRLTKRIPTGAGLGGGSADAAGALRAVDRLLGLGTAEADLLRIAASLGSDVPFALRGGSALGRGRGERLERLSVGGQFRFLVLHPPFGISTKSVFDALPAELPEPVLSAAVRAALAAGRPRALAAAVHNSLLPAALQVEPRLRVVLDRMRAIFGEHVQMTGSGSTLFRPLAPGEDPDLTQAEGVTAHIVSTA